MAKKKNVQKVISEINRALGFVEGISFGIDNVKGDLLRNALEEIEEKVEELIKDV